VAKKGKDHKHREIGTAGQPGAAAPVDSGEAGFLAEYDAAEFPHPSLTVDVALLTATETALHALVLRRDRHPELGKWALPGGFVGLDEGLDEAAARVVREKAGLSGVFLEQLYTFGDPGRDPRTRVITIAYYALVPAERLTAAGVPGGDPADLARLEVPWVGDAGGPVEALDGSGRALPLAFDHADILGISATMLFSLPQVKALIAAVRARYGPHRPRIVLGGGVFRQLPDLAVEIGADRSAADVRGVSALMQAVMAADR